jgi:HAE1 family hydrophobic/amphiphilic exporter-1
MPIIGFSQQQEGVIPRNQQIPAKLDQKIAVNQGEKSAQDAVDGKTAAGTVQQQPQQQEPRPSSLITQPLALSPPVGKERVGVRPGQQQLLTMQDAITFALQNNLDIEVARQSVQMAQSNLFSARGVYDPVTTTDISYRSSATPVTSVIQGGSESESITRETLTYNFTTDKLIERTGAIIAADFTNNRATSSDSFTTINPSFGSALAFSITQPLMRNFKIDANRRQIQLLRRSLDLSDSQFRQRVIDIISSVQRAYWDLVFAIDNEVIARNAVELTQVQLENNQKMVEAGTLPPIDLRETEAALESRKETVILALQSITTAENAVKALLLKDPNDTVWYSEIVPVDKPPIGQESFNLEEATALALKNRPELEQLRLQAQQNQIDQDFFRNQLKPRVDIFGLITSTGSAGRAIESEPDPSNPFPRQVPDRLRGGYFQALRNLGGFDFRTYQVGVTIGLPWRNRTHEGNLGRALAESRQLDARQRQLVQMVQIDVRNALQAVQATKQRYEAARASRIAAEAQLSGEQEKFRAGLSTNFLVLQRQNDFAAAQGAELRAKTDYNKALADLQRVTGMTLVNNNVDIPAPSTNGKTK